MVLASACNEHSFKYRNHCCNFLLRVAAVIEVELREHVLIHISIIKPYILSHFVRFAPICERESVTVMRVADGRGKVRDGTAVSISSGPTHSRLNTTTSAYRHLLTE